MYLIRLLIVGDTGVGKTSLLLRFHSNNFIFDQKTTIGVDYKAKEIDIDGETVKLQIWDTAGQERFRSMTSAFYGKAQGVAIVFDVTRIDTFQSLNSWINDIRELAPPSCKLVLCANKVDMPEELWRVHRDEFIAYAAEWDMPCFECSASNGQNIQETFHELGKQVLATSRDQLTQVEEDTTGKSADSKRLANLADNRKTKRRGGCCGGGNPTTV